MGEKDSPKWQLWIVPIEKDDGTIGALDVGNDILHEDDTCQSRATMRFMGWYDSFEAAERDLKRLQSW